MLLLLLLSLFLSLCTLENLFNLFRQRNATMVLDLLIIDASFGNRFYVWENKFIFLSFTERLS